MLAKFNAIPGINLPPDVISRRPSIPLAQLLDNTVSSNFLGVFEWFINEIRNPVNHETLLGDAGANSPDFADLPIPREQP
jgi:hypothetical protein